ncbi:hypothetical protein TrRE_jg5786 [Triparma retinervis]|uniref:Serine hydrolase domain-containing protein n=1 Tax=Triparma retinervis TaxID=2557542 RepID=A0A9W7F6I1_9STRA|nr:hypothetical protein TrRE_jg5786 [Triparma retinervis]
MSGEFEFVFADGPYEGGLWIPDPPGGKAEPTTDPHVADNSLAALDAIVAAEGPFLGILGYSQGSAFAPVYLSHAPGTFQKAFLFAGYVPHTHEGLVASIDARAPFSDVSALVWMGANDYAISNRMTEDQALLFESAELVFSQAGHHAVPGNEDATLCQVLAFFREEGIDHCPADDGGYGGGKRARGL